MEHDCWRRPGKPSGSHEWSSRGLVGDLETASPGLTALLTCWPCVCWGGGASGCFSESQTCPYLLGTSRSPSPSPCPGLCPPSGGAEPPTASARAPGVIGAPCPTGLLGSPGGMKLGGTLCREPPGELPAPPPASPSLPPVHLCHASHSGCLGLLFFVSVICITKRP